MFSKSRRFDEKPVGCGADAAYNVKKPEKAVGGVIPRSDRFVEPRPPASDTESVHSDKSSQVFRTPRSVRKAAPSTASKKTIEYPKKPESEVLKEQLDDAETKIRSKDATIAENDFEIHNMKKSTNDLENKLKALSEILTKCGKCSKEHEKLHFSNGPVTKNEAEQSELELYLQRVIALLSENESLRLELAYVKKSSGETESKLKEQLQMLDEEVFGLEKELKEFNLNLSCDDDEPLVKKLVALRNIFQKQHQELDALNLSLMNAEKEVLDLKDESAKTLNEVLLTAELQDKINSLEAQILDLNDYDEKRSIDLLALSDLVNSKDQICKGLMDKLEEQAVHIGEMNENLATVKQHHALALEANESIRNEYKIKMDLIKIKHEEELCFVNKQYKQTMEAIEKQHSEEIEAINEKNDDQLKTLKYNFSSKLKHFEENSYEKMRICEIQFEERLQELQLHHESRFTNEKESWMKRQETLQNQMANMEKQLKALQSELEKSQMQTTDLSQTILMYNVEIEKLSEDVRKIETVRQTERAVYENEIYQLKTNLDYTTIELKKYTVTWETSMHTVEVLKNRLRNSDEEVECLRNELDVMTASRNNFEELLTAEKEAFQNFKSEYNNLLMSIIDSKNNLDKSHNEILERNNEVIEIIKTIEHESKEEIESLKILLLNDLDAYKCIAMDQISDMESKLKKEHSLLIEMKNNCDKAYQMIDSCQTMIYNAEYQLEVKDQELDELATEKDKINGTMAALEEEKNELQVLLKEFKILAEEKDQKIHDLYKQIDKQEDIINELERDNDNHIEQLSFKISEMKHLKEQETRLEEERNIEQEELASLYDELLIKHDSLQEDIFKLEYIIKCNEDKIEDLENENVSLKHKISNLKLHTDACNKEDLELQCSNLQHELSEITAKYTDILGHHNNKQKIKHVNDLKIQNSNLKEENEKFVITVQKQNALIERLKKDLSDTTLLKNPSSTRKQLLLVGKENSPSKSPIRLESPNKQLFVLKDLNR